MDEPQEWHTPGYIKLANALTYIFKKQPAEPDAAKIIVNCAAAIMDEVEEMGATEYEVWCNRCGYYDKIMSVDAPMPNCPKCDYHIDFRKEQWTI